MCYRNDLKSLLWINHVEYGRDIIISKNYGLSYHDECNSILDYPIYF